MGPSPTTGSPRTLPTNLALGGLRLVTVGAQFLLIHLVGSTSSLGELALILALFGLTPWFLLADLGMGQPLQNAVARARALGQPVASIIAAAWRRGAMAWLAGLALVALIGVPLALHAFAAIQPAPTILACFLVMGGSTLTLAVLGLGLRVLAGHGRFLEAGIITASGSLAGLVLAGIAAGCGLPPWGVLLAWFLPALGLQAWVARRVAAGPAEEAFAEPMARSGSFWLFNLAGTVVLSLDYLILARTGDPADLAIYGFLQRCLAVAIILQGTFIVPMQTRITALQAGSGAAEVLPVVLRPLGLGMVLVLGLALVLFIGGERLSHAITGHPLAISMPVLVLGVAYALVRIWTDTWVGACLALGHVTPLIGLVVLQGLVATMLWWWLVQPWGVIGVFAGHLIAFLLTTAWVAPVLVLRALRRRTATATVLPQVQP